MARGRKSTGAKGAASRRKNKSSVKSSLDAPPPTIKEAAIEGPTDASKDSTVSDNNELEASMVATQDGRGITEKEEIITEEKKRTYTLRRSTMNSSRTAPWYQRFPAQVSKTLVSEGAVTPQPKTTPSNSNDTAYSEIKPKIPERKAKNVASKARQPKKATLKACLKGLKLKFLPIGSSSFTSLQSKEKDEKKKVIKGSGKRGKLEKCQKGKKASNVTSQVKQHADENSTLIQQANFQKYLYMGYDYDSCITTNAENIASSSNDSLKAFQNLPDNSPSVKRKCQKSRRKTKTLMSNSNKNQSEDVIYSEDWKKQVKMGGKQPFTSNGKRKINDDELETPPEKKGKRNTPSLCLKIKMEPSYATSVGPVMKEPRDKKYRQEKKVKLITPYQILKGKESKPEKSTSIILKRAIGDHEKKLKYPHDWKGKLVTPSQILKGKIKMGEVKYSYENSESCQENDSIRRAEVGETSSVYLCQENEEGGYTYHQRRWESNEGPYQTGMFEAHRDKRKEFDRPFLSGKYEADTTTATSSCYLGEDEDDTEKKIQSRKAKKKKKIKKTSERKERKEKKKKDKNKKRKRKRRDRTIGDEEIVTSSHEERERAALKICMMEQEYI